MSDFQWDPNTTQVYDSSFGDTELKGTGLQLSKRSGTDFFMEASGCTLSLNVTDGSAINWPLMDGETDSYMNMHFEEGSFSVTTDGDVFLGMKSDGGRYNYSKNAKFNLTDGNVSIVSNKGRVIIGGRDKSCLKAGINGGAGALLLQALQISFCAGNVHCEGAGNIKFYARSLSASKDINDTQGVPPRFDLETANVNNTYAPQIEFKDTLTQTRSPWDFLIGGIQQGVFNFVTNGSDMNKNGSFLFYGVLGGQLTELKKGKHLAIDGDAIEPGDVDSRFLFRNIPSGTGGVIGTAVSLR